MSFSAPFGNVVWLARPSLATACDVAHALADYISETALGASLFLPPAHYCDPDIRTKWITALHAAGFTEEYADINYHYNTSGRPNASDSWGHNARRKLTKVLNRGLRFESGVSLERAYSVIRTNRHMRGYPLRMPLDQVRQTTSSVVRADAFAVVTADGRDVAAALVYHVAPGIVQVIYWGDIPDAPGAQYCMMLLASGVFDYYAASEIHTVDVGPASENGVPSPGLCNFKEIIGCSATLKPRFSK